jgi:hypothetical protein
LPTEKKLQKEKADFKKLILNDSNSSQFTYFNAKICRLLIEYLSYVQLNGLTSIDQMYLVALADTVTNVKCDVNFGKEGEDLFSKKEFLNNKSGVADDEENSSSTPNTTVTTATSQIVDNCGFKFLLALRSYNYLMRTLPLANRDRLKELGIGTFNYAWAFHSECEHELLEALPFNVANSNGNDGGGGGGGGSSGGGGQTGVIRWSDLRQYGIGWWVKNPQRLRLLIERVAKCAFQTRQDPLDAAMFYLAMKKKGVLCGLFKTVKDTKMADFFKNDFGEAKWQTAALKNAFVLLGKQRFFFDY